MSNRNDVFFFLCIATCGASGPSFTNRAVCSENDTWARCSEERSARTRTYVVGSQACDGTGHTAIFIPYCIVCVCIYSMYDTACPASLRTGFYQATPSAATPGSSSPPSVSSLRWRVRIDLLGCGSLLICYLHSLLRITSSSSFSLLVLFTILYCIPH